MSRKCPNCDSYLECLAGHSAHENNWYCSEELICGWQAWSNSEGNPKAKELLQARDNPAETPSISIEEPFDIIVRFPNEEIAENFCSQMSDGAGNGICDFSWWKQVSDTNGTKSEDWVRVVEDTKPVFFVNEMFEIE